ncbi:MAG: site-specific DNA-methyltransferase, partial [Candidatus Omnitrophica bacterium]|nr:site-specific DNA-methyltransferase [Candidatus Omnitrophota bacterium]
MARKTTKKQKNVDTLTHDDAKRPNIPTAEYQSVMKEEDQHPIRVAYERRNPDLDPQLVWRGKDVLDWSDLVVHAPPLYIQEKVHPKVLIDDLRKRTQEQEEKDLPVQLDLFADFNGLPEEASKTDFYQHEANWTNRMILGDSLQVMASLAEREGLRGKVQCIYIDPPYGIKFNSNFQWSTTSRDVKDGKADHITREPEMVKAFRDTWKDGIHSYLTYLQDRLLVARDLLSDSGSIFVQIGDENVHRVRATMDEIFGAENACSLIAFVKTTGFLSNTLPNVSDYLLWYAKNKQSVKFRQPYFAKVLGGDGSKEYTMASMADGTKRPLTKEEKDNPEIIPSDARVFRLDNLRSQGASEEGSQPYSFEGVVYPCGTNMHWKTRKEGLERLGKALRIAGRGEGKTLCYVRYVDDFAAYPVSNVWTDAASGDNQVLQKLYVVQTLPKVIERCLLMVSDPGDLVLDPTCGSGTTAYVAEQWGRRWITIDTSRVALALARARIMGARYPYYLLADSKEGREKEAELTRSAPSEAPTYGNVRHGFVYERVPHITLKSIANNTEIDVIWDKFQEKLEPLREELNKAVGESWEEWEIPREAVNSWSDKAKKLHAEWWKQRIARQKEIDASIAAKADNEFLYDKPYEDKKTVRVAGPFTVESLSPHRTLTVGADDELIDPQKAPSREKDGEADFVEMVLENLKTAGVQQAHKDDKIDFTSLTPWPGHYICAEGRFVEGNKEDGPQKRAGILVGPEFGTVSRPDLVAAAREAGDAGFDVLIACAFNYDAHSSDFASLGRIPVLKARMNADLHMAEDLKN